MLQLPKISKKSTKSIVALFARSGEQTKNEIFEKPKIWRFSFLVRSPDPAKSARPVENNN